MIGRFGVFVFLMVFIAAFPLKAEQRAGGVSPQAKRLCKQATDCYLSIVTQKEGQSTHRLGQEKNHCDQLKQECERLLKIKVSPSSLTLKQAYKDYQAAFKRYTQMVTSPSAQDAKAIQQALQAYRQSYARYKKLKAGQQSSKPGIEKENGKLDTRDIDGIATIAPADMNNASNRADISAKHNQARDGSKQLQSTSSKTTRIKVVELKARSATVVPGPYDVIEKNISSQGGQLSDARMQLQIPPGALSKSKKVTIKKIHGELPRGTHQGSSALPQVVQLGTAYDFGPDGLRFQKPVTLSLKYNDKEIPQGLKESDLQLAYYDGQKWIRIDATQDKQNNTLTASVNGFPGSIIVIVGVPVIVISGAYALITGKHKKVYQYFWGPIRKNWIHQFIQPNNPMVKKYAKRIRVTSESGRKRQIVSFDDADKLAEYLKSNITAKKPELVIGFGRNDQQFTDLTDKYISEADNVDPVENYLKKVEGKEDKYGDCIDVTNAMVSILRHKGYKIKGVSGYINGKPHAWSEVIIGDEVYGIDEYGRISKIDYLKKHVTYPDAGDPMRKEWDEKGTRVYQPSLLIAKPSGPIYAQDGKKYVFTAKPYGLPKNVLFSWNFNNVGNSIKSPKKTFSYRFAATGKFTLKVTAYWKGKEVSKTIGFTVKGQDQKIVAIKDCKNKTFHFNNGLEEFNFLLLTPPELFVETSRFIGHPPNNKQKKFIFKQFKADYKDKKTTYQRILPDTCVDAIKNQQLFVTWDGEYQDKSGTKKIFKRGYPLKKSGKASQPAKMPQAGNPYGGPPSIK